MKNWTPNQIKSPRFLRPKLILLPTQHRIFSPSSSFSLYCQRNFARIMATIKRRHQKIHISPASPNNCGPYQQIIQSKLMNKTSSKLGLVTFILLLLQIAPTHGQPQNPPLATTPNPRCSATDTNGICVNCIEGFYLSNGNCSPVNALCLTYSMTSGICLSCFSGFSLWGSTCVELASLNPFCVRFSGIDCTICKSGYLLTDGVCTFANPNCGSYDIAGNCLNCSRGSLNGSLCLTPSICQTDQNGNCKTCPLGYTGPKCISVSSLNPFCSTYAKLICTACIYGYYLRSGNCAFANPFCLTADSKGNCISCAKGYTISGNLCIVNDICKTTNPITNICSACNTGFVLSGTSCVAQVTLYPFCLTFSGTRCLNCVTGYYINGGTCIYPNIRCLTSDPTTKLCLTCFRKYFLINGQCLPVSPLCNSNALDGSCTSCFSGYTLTGSICVTRISINPFCLTFQGSLCTKCQNRYFLGNNTICTPVNSLCNTYSMNTGICITCITGYSISNGSCLTWITLNPQCVTFNNLNGNCVNCPDRYYLGPKTICSPVNPLCRTYSMFTGNCNSCITGYSISNGGCLVWSFLNPQCASFNNSTGSCLKCNNGYYLGSKTLCTQVNPLCNTYSMSTGICSTCITGYSMVDGNCISWRNLNQQCNNFNANGNCLNCTNGFYLGLNTICTKVSPLCINYDMNSGNCVSCINGYTLVDQNCFTTVSNCAFYTPQGQCQTCDIKYTLANQMCNLIVLYCASYNATGKCSQCDSGYTLVGLDCVTIIPSCESYSSNGKQCQECLAGYTLYNGYCYTPVQNCASFDPTTSLCNSCNSGYYLVQQNGLSSCVSLPNYCLTVDYSRRCLTCTKGNIIYNNLCVPETSIAYCQGYSLSTFTCLTCIRGYYFASNNICNELPLNCVISDSNGNCQQCLSGNTLVGQNCFATISNCDTYTPNGQCKTCNTAFTLVDQSCFTTINNCATYTSIGGCNTCVSGYSISSQRCQPWSFFNPQCANFDNKNGNCRRCNDRYYIGNNTLCVLVNSLCKAYDMNSGNCTSCIQGYILLVNFCQSLSIHNPKCLTFNDTSCINCSPRYYIGPSTICSQVSRTCDTYQMNTGNCVACIFGHSLSKDNCLSWEILDPPCIQFDNSNGNCLNCMNGYFIINTHRCSAFIPSCNNYDLNTGGCLSCNYGYVVTNKICISAAVLNPNCLAFNDTTCLSCKDRYYIATNGNCTAVSSLCTTYNNITGACTNCISSYLLVNGTCISYTVAFQNPYCTNFNGTTCVYCSNPYYLSPNAICLLVSSLCRTYAMQTGACTSCYDGWATLDTTCVQTTAANPRCTAFSNNRICINCTNRYYLGNNNTCTAVSQTCNTYEMTTGLCFTCYFPWRLTEGSCIY